jgi:hypothetical protein
MKRGRPAEEDGVRVVRSTVAISVLAAALLGASLARADANGPYEGTYKASGNGVNVTVRVADSAHAVLRYSLRSECGRARGTLELEKRNGGLAGKRVSAGPHRSVRRVTARVAAVGDGTEISGVINDAVSGGKDEGACRAKRKFKAALGKSNAFVPGRDGGHYVGQDRDGHPISFDVVGDFGAGQAQITEIAVDVAADCLDVGDDDVGLVVHLSGLEGTITNGEIEVDATDEINEFWIYGEIAGGQARMEVWIDGFFDPLGLPDLSGDLYCDNEGPTYTAELV